ncbi:MAG TPA: TetR family transcriptional regulator [Acidimicrobiales bacterium]
MADRTDPPRPVAVVMRDAIREHLTPGERPGEGLRERKKRLTRQQISNTATSMFLEQGFDQVRVADVAAACGVSEKTVYNYFPTKETLVLDREDAMGDAIRRALGPGAPEGSPIDAAVAVLVHDMDELCAEWHRVGDHGPKELEGMIRRFGDMIDATPSLRAAQRDMMDRLVSVAAEAMASRAGVHPDDPEPQIAADAILGLWRIQFLSMQRYADGTHTVDQVRDLVVADVRRAARLVDTGLWSFGMAVQGSNGREQLKAAADAANEARKQVLTAIRQARTAWRTMADQAHGAGDGSESRPDPRAATRARQEAQRTRQRAQRDLQQARRDEQEARRQAADAKREALKAGRDAVQAAGEALKAGREASRLERERAAGPRRR